MSINLTPIDLTGVVVGQQKTLLIGKWSSSYQLQPNEVAHIRIFNESACGLTAQFNSSGRTEFVPAGAWPVFELHQNDTSITFQVTYILPNPPVSTINAVYYAFGEKVPDTPQLGNSPIGIGGSVNTSNVQTLSNEPPSTIGILVIDMGDTNFSQIISMFNDGHCLWAVDQSGVKHQVIKVSTTANALQLGQAGDVVEVLGAILVDQTLHIIGAVQADTTLLVSGKGTFTANPAIQADTMNSNASSGADGILSVSGSGATQITRLQSANQIILQVPAGSGRLTVDATNVTLAENLNATTATFTGTVATARTTFTTGGYSNQVVKSGTGSGTAAFGVVPFTVFCDPCTLSGSSQTIGITKASSATVTTGAALAWDATAIN